MWQTPSFPASFPPHHYHSTPSSPSRPNPAHHSTPPLASPVSSNTRAIAKKSGYSARTWGTCSEMVPFRVSEMWFPIRLSKAELQARATLAVPGIAIVFCTIIPILRKMMRSSSLHPTQSHTDPHHYYPSYLGGREVTDLNKFNWPELKLVTLPLPPPESWNHSCTPVHPDPAINF